MHLKAEHPTKLLLTNLIRLGSLFSILFSSPASVFAFQFETSEMEGSFDTTVSIGARFRIQSPSVNLIDRHNGGAVQNAINTDDGNRHFEKGLVSAALKFTHDFELNFRNYGSFIRASYFYDPVVNNKDHLADKAKERVGHDFDILDAYVFGYFEPAGKSVELRFGNQVINWGESMFISNGVNVINPVDVSRFRVPGAEIREALMPTPIIWASQALTENVSVEGFYILKFRHTEIDPMGSYFSSNDVVSDGATHLVAGFGSANENGDIPGSTTPFPPSAFIISRNVDVDAKDSGEIGFALRWFAPEFNETEFGLFAMNYHSRLPVGSFIAGTPGTPPMTANYFVEYPENIHMAGVSFNTLLPFGGIALQGEYSYRSNMPLQLEFTEVAMASTHTRTTGNEVASQLGSFSEGDYIQGYRRHKVGQAQMTATKVFSHNNPFKADSWLLLTEVAMTKVYNLPAKSELRFEAAGTNLPARNDVAVDGVLIPQQDNGWADAFSWGYRFMTRTSYNNVFRSVNLSPRVFFAHDVRGTTPGPGGNFIEDRKALTLAMEISYLQSWTFDTSITRFFGAEGHNAIADRDFIAMNIKYGL